MKNKGFIAFVCICALASAVLGYATSADAQGLGKLFKGKPKASNIDKEWQTEDKKMKNGMIATGYARKGMYLREQLSGSSWAGTTISASPLNQYKYIHPDSFPGNNKDAKKYVGNEKLKASQFSKYYNQMLTKCRENLTGTNKGSPKGTLYVYADPKFVPAPGKIDWEQYNDTGVYPPITYRGLQFYCASEFDGARDTAALKHYDETKTEHYATQKKEASKDPRFKNLMKNIEKRNQGQ